ncbi:MAG TPA: flagellar hook protein FlgE [Actinobacteria bacterium]|nr:flagellar hook protein FlgE [Actinomycetota bacterium]
MMRSMFSGVSGLRSHQTMMDVVGHNIANVNTAGFKSSQVTFEEALTQTLGGPSGAGVERGGTNPIQLGLGVKIASTDGVFTQGATQVTGRPTDLAIQGDGFFILEGGGERVYTRAGTFRFDELGNLVAPGGMQVLGWMADPTGAIDNQVSVSPITLPLTQVIEPNLTTEVLIGGNLPSDLPVGDVHRTSISIVDSRGEAHDLLVEFQKTAANTWSMSATVDGNPVTLSTTTLTFDTDGTLASPTSFTVSGYTPPGADPLNFTVRLDGDAPLVQYGGVATAEALSQDGNPIGFLRDFSIGADGSINGVFSNGESKRLAQIATATFNNPSGLLRKGESQFTASVNSGQALIGAPGGGGKGTIAAGALEMSNVDLAQEFTNLIIAQRGFQANSRIITASDEVLADLVNMKR